MNPTTHEETKNRLDVASRCMLVNLSFGSWRARKLDKAETAAVNAKHGTNAFRTVKQLVDKSKLDGITKNQTEARAYHNSVTVPYDDKGRRVLNSSIYLEYTTKLNQYKAEHDRLVSEFIADYPSIVAEAQRLLNGAFNPDDYPDQYAIAYKFRFGCEVEPIPQAGNFLVSMQQDEVEMIAKQIEATVHAKLTKGMQDVFKRLHTAVAAMAEKLPKFDPEKTGAERGTFRDSLVQNMVDICEVLPALNLTQDPALDAMADECQAKLTKYSAALLRDDSAAREETAQAAQELLDKMSAFAA